MAISKKTITKQLKTPRSLAPGAFVIDQANLFTLVLKLPTDETFDGITELWCEFHDQQFPLDEEPLCNVVLSSPTGTSATFDFDGDQMNQPMEAAERSLWMVAFAVTDDAPPEILWRANVTMQAHNASQTAGGPPDPARALNTTLADARYAALVHTHAQSSITNLVADLAGKAASSHTHAMADVTDLAAALAGKADSSHTHTMANVTDLAAALELLAPLASPALTGNPTAPTQSPGNNSTRLATTAYVDASAAVVGNAASAELAGEVDDLWTVLNLKASIAAVDLKAPLIAPTFQGAAVFGTGGPGGGNSVEFGIYTALSILGLTTYGEAATFDYLDAAASASHRAALGFLTLSDYVTLAGGQTLTNKTLTDATLSGVLYAWNPANTFAYTIAPAAIAAARTLNLPLITATDTLAALGLAQTWTAQQTMTTPLFKTSVVINNPANTFAYTLTPAAIAANRVLNLPLITGTDTLATIGLSQTFTGAANYITNGSNGGTWYSYAQNTGVYLGINATGSKLFTVGAHDVNICTATSVVAATFKNSGNVFQSYGGRITAAVADISTSFTATASHHLVTFSNAGAVTANLPVGVTGTVYRFKNKGAGTVTITPNGSQKLFTSAQVATLPLVTGESVNLHFDGTDWLVFKSA